MTHSIDASEGSELLFAVQRCCAMSEGLKLLLEQHHDFMTFLLVPYHFDRYSLSNKCALLVGKVYIRNV